MTLYQFGRGIVNTVFHIFFQYKVTGRENIPVDENFVVCANHSSNLDPPFVGVAVEKQICYMAKEELFSFKPFGKLITALGAFPIKRGKSDISALRGAIRKIKSGQSVAVFPEGGRNNRKQLRRGKHGAALIAAHAEVKILPIGIAGKYRPFGNLCANIGKPLQIPSGADGKIADSRVLQEFTDEVLMKEISRLSGVPAYENKNSR